MSEYDEIPEIDEAETDLVELEDDVEDFDAFWSAHDKRRKRPKLRLFGQVIELPPAIPLQFELEAKKLARSKKDKDVRKLVGILFGADAYEQWAEAGMDIDQFKLLLVWGPRRIAGQRVTLAEVAAEVAAEEAKQEARRAAKADPS